MSNMVEGPVHHPDIHEAITTDPTAQGGIKHLRLALERKHKMEKALAADPTLTEAARELKLADDFAATATKATRECERARAALATAEKGQEQEIDGSFKYPGDLLEADCTRRAAWERSEKDAEFLTKLLPLSIERGDLLTVSALLTSRIPAWIVFGLDGEASRDMYRQQWAMKVRPLAVARLTEVRAAKAKLDHASRAFLGVIHQVEQRARPYREAAERAKAALAEVEGGR